MKTKYIIPLLGLILLVVAFFTNPKKEVHRETLKTKLTAAIDESMQEKKNDIVIYNAWQLGKTEMVDLFVKNFTSIDNYYVCSLTRLHWDSESYVVGIGAFGNVWITKRINKELVDIIIANIENTVHETLPDFMQFLQ